MMRAVSMKYAVRSLFRHKRRTFFSMLGVGVGCAMALLAASWMGGAFEMQIRALCESGAGHLRVAPAAWGETHDNRLRIENPSGVFDAVGTQPGVKFVAPRSRATALLAFGNRTSGVEMLGVDPSVEAASNRVVQKATIEGRYLKAGDTGQVVIGKVLARRLDAQLDDDLLITLAGKDDIESAMIRVVGILETGGHDVDATICHVTLGDVARLTGYNGPAEINIVLEEHRRIDEVHASLAGQVGGGNCALSWKEVNPSWAAGVEGDQRFMRSLVGIIVIVVSLGIASAQLTAVLERRREFAILSALGMKSRQVVGLVMMEGVVIGLGGAVLALMIGGTGAYFLSTKGVDFAAMVDGDLAVGDILMDPVLYGEFGPWLLTYAFGVSVGATVLASIYPAWLATKVDPARALRMV